MRGHAGELAPTGPLAAKRLHSLLDSPRAGALRDGLGQLIDGQLGVREGFADGRDHLFNLFRSEADPFRVRRRRRHGRQRTGPHRQLRSWQQVDRAARAERLDQGAVLPQRTLHVSAGSACNAAADEISAAVSTWACTPHTTAATPAGSSSADGSVSATRAIRRAVTALQVRDTEDVECAAMRRILPLTHRIPHAAWRSELPAEAESADPAPLMAR